MDSTKNTNIYSQTVIISQLLPDSGIVDLVDEKPQFAGGEQELRNYLANNIKYPLIAKTHNIHGKVFINFVIDKNGDVRNVKIIRGIGFGCDEEALRLVRNMPRWIPCKQKGQRTTTSFNLPISFN
jgi:protein TonB